MFLFLSILTVLCSPTVGSELSNRLKILQFGDSENNYIGFYPDLTPFVRVISVCGWIKDLGTYSYRSIIFFEKPWNEFALHADGRYIGIFNSYMHKQSSFTVPKGTWHHVCATWSYSSRTHRYYVNGVLLGSQTTPSGRYLTAGGRVTIGMLGSWYFGGQMTYLNLYNKELTSSEISRKVRKGMCLDALDDELYTYRTIKWEDIVKLPRTGTVTDVENNHCNPVKWNTEIEETRAEKEKVEEQLNSTMIELEVIKVGMVNREERLNSTILELKEVKEEKILIKTEERLNATHAELEETALELEEMLASLNQTWDWDIFLTDQFVNKTFTAENLQLIQSSWDKVAEALVGIKITDKFLKLLQQVDTTDRPWAVLREKLYFNQNFTEEMSQRLTTNWDEIGDKLVGVTFTEAIVELLNYVTQRANCGK